MARFIALLALLLVLVLPGAQSAEAMPIVGSLSVSLNYLPNCGNDVQDCMTLGSATGLDFIAFSGTTPTPGTAGAEFVNQATGDLVGFVGAFGLIRDFSFSGSGSLSFPSATIPAWETIGGLTFDLTSVRIISQDSSHVDLEGTGIFHLAGFDDTPGTFILTANDRGGAFSASASKATVPEGGMTLTLLGGAFMALAGLRRRFRS